MVNGEEVATTYSSPLRGEARWGVTGRNLIFEAVSDEFAPSLIWMKIAK